MSATKPATRQELIDYCLRKLGHPVLEINIDDDQVEDRIDEAIDYYQQYHYNAIEEVYLNEQIAASTMTVEANGLNVTVGEVLTGATSGATCIVYAISTDTVVKVIDFSGTFVAGETVVGGYSNTNLTLVSVVLGNYDNKYITLPESVMGISGVLPFTNTTNGIDLFDVRYQIILNDLYSIQSTDIIYYNQVKTELELINQLLVGQKQSTFNRHQNRLYIHMDWRNDVAIGNYIVIQAQRILDPADAPGIYNDYFLKKFAVALLKQQWGTNLKKFDGVMLPGGVTLNGQKIYDEATLELEALEKEMQETFQEPVNFYVG